MQKTFFILNLITVFIYSHIIYLVYNLSRLPLKFAIFYAPFLFFLILSSMIIVDFILSTKSNNLFWTDKKRLKIFRIFAYTINILFLLYVIFWEMIISIGSAIGP
jgi:hypothetical protein